MEKNDKINFLHFLLLFLKLEFGLEISNYIALRNFRSKETESILFLKLE